MISVADLCSISSFDISIRIEKEEEEEERNDILFSNVVFFFFFSSCSEETILEIESYVTLFYRIEIAVLTRED